MISVLVGVAWLIMMLASQRRWNRQHLELLVEVDGLKEDRARALRLVDKMHGDRDRACRLVAEMHAAAMGEVIGPKRGVVEDVEDLRCERDKLRIALGDIMATRARRRRT